MALSSINRINTNLVDLETTSIRTKTGKTLENSLRKLISGNRLYRAEEDAASFSISAKLIARIQTLDQNEQNILDAKSMLNIMSENLGKLVELLIKIKEKVLMAANAVSGPDEREMIRRSINGFANEITSIVEQTTYNRQSILAKGFSATFQVGETINDTLQIDISEDLTAQDVQVEEVTSQGALSSSGTILTTSTLNEYNQFTAMQAGDTFDIVLTAGDGSQETVSFIAAGSKGQLTTSTVQGVINAINSSSNWSASFDNATESILVRETVRTVGNALAVQFNNFSEFTGLDGASGSLSFSFQSSSGTLRSNLSGATVAGGTQLNSFDQFSLLEGQDTLTINLTDRSGYVTSVTLTLSGSAGQTSSATLSDLQNAINVQAAAKFTASITSGQLQVEEINKAQLSFIASSSFIENNINTGAASVSIVNFLQISEQVTLDGVSGISALTQLDDALGGIGTGFIGGDSFDIVLTANDGSTQSHTFTFITGSETYQDLINEINGNTTFNAAISGGELIITEGNQTIGTSLDTVFNNFVGTGSLSNQTFSESGARSLTSFGELTPVFTTATLLNNLNEFTNVQQGDTLTVTITNAAGGDESFLFTFTGAPSGNSTSTIQNLIDSINSNTTLTASFDIGSGSIVLVDTFNTGNGISLSFANSDFTEFPRPNNGSINLTFSYSGEDMVSNVLQSGFANVNTSTKLTNIDGWGTLEGDDTIRIQLRTRAGTSQTFDFNLTDVAEGVTSNHTIGDLVNFIDGQTIGSIQFSASLSGGQIVVTEDNSPAVGGFTSSTSFGEHNIDITPKSFSNVNFQISQFLPLDSVTGLVIGLGLLDFNSGTSLTQSTSVRLLANVEDSINRLVDVSNRVGITQNRLDRRYEFVQQHRITNSAANSRIRDVNFAAEYSRYIRNQIIQQYQGAEAVQANLASQYLLALL